MPSSVSNAPKDSGINPAYVVGGVLAGGMGGAALEQYRDNRKHTPGMIETAATGILGGMDRVVGAAGSAMSMIEMPIQPIMLGGLAVNMLGHPIAKGLEAIGLKSPLQGVEWASKKLSGIESATFSEVGKKISPALGRNVGAAADRAIKATAPVLDRVSHLPGLGGLHSKNLQNTKKAIANTSAFHGIWQATLVGGAAVQNYMVARDFGSQVHALRRLQADMTGKDISEVSSISVLTGAVEKPVEIARAQLLKISGAHAFASVAGLAMAIKNNWINEKLGAVAGKIGIGGGLTGVLLMGATFSLPSQISEFVEGIVGEPVLAAYGAMRDAEEAGHKFNAAEYAGFLFAASGMLRNLGNSKGQILATRLGEQYAEEGTSIVEILREVYDGRMNKRAEALVASSQVEKLEARKQQPASSAVSPIIRRQEQEALGPMTAMLKEREALASANKQVGIKT